MEVFERERADLVLPIHPRPVENSISFNKDTQLHTVEHSIKPAHVGDRRKPLPRTVRNRVVAEKPLSELSQNKAAVLLHSTRSSNEFTPDWILLTIGAAREIAFCSVWPTNDFSTTRAAAIVSPLRSLTGMITETLSFSLP